MIIGLVIRLCLLLVITVGARSSKFLWCPAFAHLFTFGILKYSSSGNLCLSTLSAITHYDCGGAMLMLCYSMRDWDCNIRIQCQCFLVGLCLWGCDLHNCLSGFILLLSPVPLLPFLATAFPV